MAKQGVYSIEVDPVQFKNLRSALNSLDKETQSEIRDMAFPLSSRLAGQLVMFAMESPTPQAKLVAQSVVPKRDRLVRVDIGGTKKVGRQYHSRDEKLKSGKGKLMSAKAGALLWGSEYGSNKGVDSRGRAYTNRFKVGHRIAGYWIAPAVSFYTPIVASEYSDLLQKVINRNGLGEGV